MMKIRESAMLATAILFATLGFAISPAVVIAGNARIINAGDQSVEIIVRQYGMADEDDFLLDPGDAVSLTDHRFYEVFLPQHRIVFDVDAGVGSPSNPWDQKVYCLSRSDNQWQTHRGIADPLRRSAAEFVRRSGDQLSNRWRLELDGDIRRDVDPSQKLGCQLFMLEKFIFDRLGLRVWLLEETTVDDAGYPTAAGLIVETPTCFRIDTQLKNQVVGLVAEATKPFDLKVRFEATCPIANEYELGGGDSGFEIRGDGTADYMSEAWNAFTEAVMREPVEIVPAHLDENPFFGTELKTYDWELGINASNSQTGDLLSLARYEYQRVLEIADNPNAADLTMARSATIKDIRRLVELAIGGRELRDPVVDAMVRRVHLHYGCSLLYAADPNDYVGALSIDFQPVVDLLRPDNGEYVVLPKHYRTMASAYLIDDIEIDRGPWKKTQYRIGLYELMIRMADPSKRERMRRIYESHWKDLPDGFVGGTHFKSDVRYSVKLIDGTRNKIENIRPRPGVRIEFLGGDEGHRVVSLRTNTNRP